MCHLRCHSLLYMGPASLLDTCPPELLDHISSLPLNYRNITAPLSSSPISPFPHLHPLLSSSTPHPPKNTPHHLCPANPPSTLLSWAGLVPSLPHVVMPLDVNLVENPLWGLQEVFLHLHGDIPGQEAHEQPLLKRRNIICQTARTSPFLLA